ncbi:hypothetical protein GLAREA_07574 [Glarea lozoyensis ATCC 20868]|uniref:Uncharacterized protein n=1 Tax=Glarea lozoyensis (strain ATCC 20868 / MF5171) TaxID=1116229 RepID=S3DK56_GLAL2|nr:uncharacterized protein GLAREA_07574 [Glarea lozoyensis ATCC 20868]EPE32441.1 hypothetical protein GLAREA_07574 [Glarea lozoyensis ATCC 20868]
MPPKGTKRKAPLVASNPNVIANLPESSAKKAKRTATGTATKKSEEKRTFKYSNKDSLEKEFPKIVACKWPIAEAEEYEGESEDEGSDEGSDEEESAEPEEGTEKEKLPGLEDEEKITTQAQIDVYGENNRNAYLPSVFKAGHCVTRSGVDRFLNIVKECNARDQDLFDMHIYTDWSGWGATEVLENALADFNKDLFKKNISPLQKWSHLEGIVTWLKLGDLFALISNENGPGVGEVFDMFIPMYITCLEVLSEHDLVKKENTPAFNINTMTLLLLEFYKDPAADFDTENVEDIVLAADLAGVKLVPRVDINISQEDIENWRKKGQVNEDGFDEKEWRSKWDWKKLFKEFKPNHPGGRRYDITKMSGRERRQYVL